MFWTAEPFATKLDANYNAMGHHYYNIACNVRSLVCCPLQVYDQDYRGFKSKHNDTVTHTDDYFPCRYNLIIEHFMSKLGNCTLLHYYESLNILWANLVTIGWCTIMNHWTFYELTWKLYAAALSWITEHFMSKLDKCRQVHYHDSLNILWANLLTIGWYTTMNHWTFYEQTWKL